MARNLLRAGHELVVYNRTRSRAEELGREGARVAGSPREAAGSAEALVTVSTISHTLSRRLADEHQSRGQQYVAAPVFGRPDAAQAAKLWIVAAGPAEAIERCRPLFGALGQGLEVVGQEPPKANVVKLAGNFVLASAIEALGEALALVRKYDIDPKQVLEIVNGRVVRSPVYENYGTLIVTQRYEPAGFKLRHGLKDIRLALGAGEEVTVPLPLASLLRDEYLAAMARGWGDIDWAGLARLSAVNAGLEG